MGECTHNCESCSENCKNRSPESLIESLGKGSEIKKVIAVVSGKGGVGKSLVTSLLAVNAQRAGKKACILDADVTGPSIPKIFGMEGGVTGTEEMMMPPETKTGIKMISVNLLLENESDPVAWRGPIIANVVKQFWNGVYWGHRDIMFIDMPPGTGDVPLTVFQSIPVDGIIIVTSPQDLVSMIVAKAVKMAALMNKPILGIVENYSYFECPDCKKHYEIFGESKVDAAAKQFGIPYVAKIPVDPRIARACDSGTIEDYNCDFLDPISKNL